MSDERDELEQAGLVAAAVAEAVEAGLLADNLGCAYIAADALLLSVRAHERGNAAAGNYLLNEAIRAARRSHELTAAAAIVAASPVPDTPEGLDEAC